MSILNIFDLTGKLALVTGARRRIRRVKAEAQAEMEKLDQDVSMAVAGGVGYGFTIG